MSSMQNNKGRVKAHWEEEACGTRHGEAPDRRQYFREISEARYGSEPYIAEFAGFRGAAGKKVLEIGVGAGCDFINWVQNNAKATGVDLTERAIELTRERLALQGVDENTYSLLVGDAERLGFEENSFDIVYSWGCLHHSPNTERAFGEACRVLKPGGAFKAMVYHVPSWVGWLLWVRHALLKLKPFTSVKSVIFHNLESPGTKAYTREEAKDMLEQAGFIDVKLHTELSPADLLDIRFSSKYQGLLYRLAAYLYPRGIVRLLGGRYGLYLLIDASK